LQALGGGIQDVAGALFEVKQREQLQADQTAVTEADRQLGQVENGLLYDPQNGALTKQGKDAIRISGPTLTQYDQQTARVAGSLVTPRAKRVFQEAAGKRRLDIERELAGHEVQQREVYADNEAKSYVLQSVDSAANHWNDPIRVSEELNRQRAVIEQQASRKGWSSAQKDVALRAAQSDLHTGVVGRMIGMQQIGKASEYLAVNAPNMDDTAVESLQRRILSEEDAQVRRQEHQQKLAADATAKNGDKLFAQGQLTSAWIEAHRNTLDAQDYRYFYGKLTGNGEGPRDASTYADLREAAGRGEDVRADARRALQSGAIRSSDWDRIIGEVEQQRPGWYPRGKQYITNMAGVSELNPDPSAKQTLGTMLDQWDDWTTSHPKATDKEAQAAYQDLVTHNMLVQRAGLPMPRFSVGNRFDLDLQNTAKATIKARDAGQLAPDEYQRQMQILKQWKDALLSESAAQPARKSQ
jgi:hypothetical protein